MFLAFGKEVGSDSVNTLTGNRLAIFMVLSVDRPSTTITSEGLND
jgi:hypothetical protein